MNKLQAHQAGDESFKITLSTVLSLATQAHQLFKSSKNEQKRKLTNFMFSNLKLNGSKVRYTLCSPFDLLTILMIITNGLVASFIFKCLSY
jgi:hypothetical protein